MWKSVFPIGRWKGAPKRGRSSSGRRSRSRSRRRQLPRFSAFRGSERTGETEVGQAATRKPNSGAASVATMTLEKSRESEALRRGVIAAKKEGLSEDLKKNFDRSGVVAANESVDVVEDTEGH